MSTLSSSQSPSPSLPSALWSLVTVLIFPILCLKWGIKCEYANKSEWKGFALFGLLGIVELILIIFNPSHTFLWMSMRTWGLILYPCTLVVSLLFLSVVKDEFEKGPA